VPEESIVRFAGVTKIFVVEQDKVRAVPVEIGTRLTCKRATLCKAAALSMHWSKSPGNCRRGRKSSPPDMPNWSDGTLVRVRGTEAAPQVSPNGFASPLEV